MALGLDAGVSSAAWTVDTAGHVLHGALMILLTQVDAGVMCPMSMTYACVPALGADEEIAKTWTLRATAQSYDKRFIPASEKTGVHHWHGDDGKAGRV